MDKMTLKILIFYITTISTKGQRVGKIAYNNLVANSIIYCRVELQEQTMNENE